jgi:hypothetical protein
MMHGFGGMVARRQLNFINLVGRATVVPKHKRWRVKYTVIDNLSKPNLDSSPARSETTFLD